MLNRHAKLGNSFIGKSKEILTMHKKIEKTQKHVTFANELEIFKG